MNKHLQTILNLLQHVETLTSGERKVLADAVNESDKELTITQFKLERTEKVKRTTAILLEETIAELEQKRKSVEAQNRELEIEAALERIRARAMAMHTSSELIEVANVLREQMRLLDTPELETSAVLIYHSDQESWDSWYAFRATNDPEGKIKNGITTFSKDSCEFAREIVSMYQSASTDYTLELRGAKREEWLEVLMRAAPEIAENAISTETVTFATTYFHFSNFHGGSLLTVSYSPALEEIKILQRRAASVFGLAYQRFRDLQKAEAQTRESQIQLALERVRSRSMAMHRSEEISEILGKMYTELTLLDVVLNRVLIWIFHPEEKYIDWWAANPEAESNAESYRVDYTDHPVFITYLEAWEKRVPLLLYTLGGEMKASWEDHLFKNTELPRLPETVRNGMRSESKIFTTSAISDYGLLMAGCFEPFSAESNDIIQRFGRVFQQCYTRYLDVQKAETQAREAQIEAALEKVRSRSLAMHKSEEMAFVVDELFLRMKELEIGFDSVNILEFNDDAFQIWAAYQPGKFTVTKIPFSRSDIPYVRTAVEAKNSGQQLFTHQYLFEEKNQFLKYLFEETHFKNLPNDRKEHLLQCPCYTVSIGFARNTAIQLQSYSRAAFSENENALLKRFVSVFEQSYTRFLDLQKAEAQARESQIQLALERGRTQSMIMQHSRELDDTLRVFHEQVLLLNINSAFSFLWLPDDEKDRHIFWAAWAEKNAIFNSKSINYPLDRNEPATAQCLIDWKSKEPVVSYHVPPAGVESYFAAWQELIAGVEQLKPEYFSEGLYYVEAFMKYGCFGVIVKNPLVEDEKKILARFAVEFERAYTRFLDLQKAEAQTREAQIEAGLERVRSRTMAMQRSEELLEVASVMFEQVKALGVPQWNCGFNIWNIGDKEFTYYPGSPDGKILPITCQIPLTEHPVFRRFDESRRRGEDLLIYEKQGEEQQDHYRYMLSLSGVGDFLRSMLDAGFQLPTFQIDHVANFLYGNLIFITYEHFPEMHDAFKRFAKVFEQTYTRFLDLQKAEAQAREAQIEGALEKVRSRSLAMHDSSELREVVTTVFEKLQELNFTMNDGAAVIMIFIENSKDHIQWVRDPGHSYTTSFKVPYSNHSLPSDILNAREMGVDFFSKIYPFEEKNAYFKYLFQHSDEYNRLPDDIKTILLEGEYGISVAFARNSAIAIPSNSGRLLSGNEQDILKRFVRVFEQAYVRFLDLQKAEAQAREAQIEASLERVRSKTMAMHSSQDVGDTVATLFDELKKLDVKTNRCGILIFSVMDDTEVWTAKSTPSGEVNLIIGQLDVAMHPMLSDARNSWKNKEGSFSYELIGDDLINYYRAINNHPYYPIRVNLDALPSKENHTEFHFQDGAVFAFTSEPITVDDGQIFKRMSGVFGQTYRRYLDLLKAEAQAKEATIEAGLERVRGKALAMHNSNDLIATASLVFTELRKLGITSLRSGVGLLTKENRKIKLYSATSSAEGDSLSVVGWAVLDDHPVLIKMYDSWIANEDYYPVLKGEEIKTYYEKVVSNFSVPVAQSKGLEQHGYFLPFSEGLFYGWSEKPYSEAEIKILHRFKAIVDLTFRRYIELQKSEANAIEAIRQASLDRVRAEIASMRTTSDLDRITPLIWKELNILGIPFVRCGVFIMDGLKHQIHTFLSTPDGKAIAAFHLRYDTPGNIGEILCHWMDKQMYISHWDETAFNELGEQLVQQGAIPSKEVYTNTVPPGGVYLHCLPFMQGMLYVGNTSELKQDDIHLIQSVADAFSTAYARYEDFNKLESAKAQIEKTLADLKQTQTQLVQSEKMASLGELTAGIAHEIQNPLNFVNNFSEVNKELLTEMSTEIDKGNFSEVRIIANDVINNEEKINHHGKRADAIVKSMLQHTASGSGVKEATDINALADEFLRLAYHGLRAKDKSFNASMKTDFDESIGSINVVRQDVGRVILNLVTNAFYVVNEKKRLGSGYEPSVAVSTRRNGEKVFISIKDNGNGISQKVLDKIFQPFFTTKPTGQGTGLGLSLSYDIVKAHGGQLQVHTTEGEGSEFIVTLPA